MASAQAMLDFNSDSLTFDHTLYFVQKCPKIAKSNPIFHFKGRHVRALALTYLDTLLTEFFPYIFFLPLWPSLGENLASGVKVGPKMQILGPSRFCKN